MLGFLKLTSDVNAFELDRNVVLLSALFAVCLQLLVDSDFKLDEEKLVLKRKNSK
jgi:hypothetical protein